MKGYLVLSDRTLYEGTLFGAIEDQMGEVVFNTSMTGYQEILTDPSYYGQMVVMTYPLIGNYGIELNRNQSLKIQAKGLIVREFCQEASHWTSELDLESYMKLQGISGLSGVDTRALTKKLRSGGTMVGRIIKDLGQLEEAVDQMKTYDNQDAVYKTTTGAAYALSPINGCGLRVAVMDYGVKQSILKALLARGFELMVFPANTNAEAVLRWEPDGVFLSNGPGDPALLGAIIEEVKVLMDQVPIFGICLGHQLLCHAFGGSTEKLKFGHRGANHPVMDLSLGRVMITSQNHGYVVCEGSLSPKEVEITHVNVNDGTVEGMRHRHLPIFSVQYHPEASPGPSDSEYLFDQFKVLIEETKEMEVEKYA